MFVMLHAKHHTQTQNVWTSFIEFFALIISLLVTFFFLRSTFSYSHALYRSLGPLALSHSLSLFLILSFIRLIFDSQLIPFHFFLLGFFPFILALPQGVLNDCMPKPLLIMETWREIILYRPVAWNVDWTMKKSIWLHLISTRLCYTWSQTFLRNFSGTKKKQNLSRICRIIDG